MPIRPEDLLRDALGRPQPPSELLARLRRFDDRLGLHYTKAAWAITERWRTEDRRWEWVRNGSVPEAMAFDICGYLPINCSLDEAPAYIERELHSYTPDQYLKLRAAVAHWNDVTQDQQVEEAVRTGIEEDLTKSGPSLGKFNVPVLVDGDDDDEEDVEYGDEPSPTDEDIPPHEPEGPEEPPPPDLPAPEPATDLDRPLKRSHHKKSAAKPVPKKRK
jgi:hypothetical protein